MKIEMGESLFYSWLRHIKECQVVQTNWTFPPTQLKHFYLEEKIEYLALSAEDLFHKQLGYDIFGKNTYKQLLKQAEIDVLGVSFDVNTDDSNVNIYAIDVAFHTNGLNYKNPHSTVEKLIEKYIRSAMCIMGCFGLCNGEIIFASPIVRKSLLSELENVVEKINKLFEKLGFSFVAKLIINEKFEKSILNEVLMQTNEIADTNELFMRSCQMLGLFDSLKENTVTQNTESDVSWKINDESELKVGKYIRTIIKQLMENELLSDDEIENLKSQEYTNKTFKRNMPFLKEVKNNDNIENLRKDTRGYYRYYSELFDYKGRKFLLCQEWNERVNREPFNVWLKKVLDKDTLPKNVQITTLENRANEGDLKIGKYIRNTIRLLMKEGKLSDDEIENLKSQEYSYKIFKRNMPLLKEVNENDNILKLRKDSRGYSRYYSEIFDYKGRKFLLCQEWYEDINREPFNKWLNMILNKE